MQTVTPAARTFFIILCLLYSTAFTINAPDSTSASNENPFLTAIEAYNEFAQRVSENPGVELVSSPRTDEHRDRIREFWNSASRFRPERTRLLVPYTHEELQQFARDAQFTFCSICAWAGSGYRGEDPVIAYTLASRNDQIAQLQAQFYYQAALFIHSEERHRLQNFQEFGQFGTQILERLKRLAVQNGRE